MWSEDTVVVQQVDTRGGNEHRQLFDQLQGIKEQVRGAIGPRMGEFM